MTSTPMSADSISNLLAAKNSDLNWWTRTIRNGIIAARRDAVTYYVGRTYTRGVVTTNPADFPNGYHFACNADGTVTEAG